MQKEKAISKVSCVQEPDSLVTWADDTQPEGRMQGEGRVSKETQGMEQKSERDFCP